MERKVLAEVRLSTGRQYLTVAGFVLAMEGDPCRDSSGIPESILPPISEAELARATIGGKPAKDLPIDVVHWFRGDNWTPEMLEYVATKINEAQSNA